MEPTSNIEQPKVKSKALNALAVLQEKKWRMLNACHVCGRTAGKHKKLDPVTFEESLFGVYLMKCQHKLKVCNLCYYDGKDITVRRYSKAEKKALKKQKVKVLKAERNGVLQ